MGNDVRSEPAEAFRAARNFLLAQRADYQGARAGFRWPELTEFNWALDWFDQIARNNDFPALRIVEADGGEICRSFAEMSQLSNRVANWLRGQGVGRGDPVLLMLGHQVE